MNRAFLQIFLTVIFLTFPNIVISQSSDEIIKKTQKLIDEVAEKSFPELKLVKIEVKTFASESNYFKSRFSIRRFLTFQKMRYVIYVNAEIYQRRAPDAAIRAILAHELAHVLYYKRKNRFQLLGLAGLTDKSFRAKFERKADLEAISRGYGEGLKAFREWLYRNIPANKLESKKRDYFSPEEIDLILKKLKKNPE